MLHKGGGDHSMNPNQPINQGRLPQSQNLPHGMLHSPNMSHVLPSTLPSPYGFIYSTPTTGTFFLPGLSERQIDNQRQLEGVGMRRELDFRKRPSMLSDFHLTSAAQASHHMPTEGQTSLGKRAGPEEILIGRSAQADTKKTPLPAYTPQVEAISPTPDDQPALISSTDRDHILERISVIDHEIALTESNLKKMQKRKQELEEAAASGSAEVGSELTAAASSQTSGGLIERIYAETRRQAAAVHAKVASIGPPLESVPLYRQPSDRKEYEKIRAKHEVFKPKLIAYLRKIKRFQEIRERYLTDRYNQLMVAWRKKVERMERHPKRLAKDQKYREIFEKAFPELKKQREERERTARSCMLGPRAGLEDSVYFSSTGELEEDERTKMRQNAVVPPMLLDFYTRSRMRYVNNNGLVHDPLAEHQYRYDLFKIVWTDEEKLIFKEKFIQYGKNFAAIALFLEKKTTKDCVQYYYLTKKSENYKQLLRRKNTRRGKPYRPPQLPRAENFRENPDAPDQESVDNEGPGQREPEFICMACKAKIDASNPGRVLTRACYEQYGLDPESLHGQNVRICQKCRLGIVKRKHSQCPIGTCTTARRKVKPSRIFPAKWMELSEEDKQFSMDVTKCCGSCFKRLLRRCEIAALPEETLNDEELLLAKSELWTEEEIVSLKGVVVMCGLNNWTAVAEKLNKPSAVCRRQFLFQKQSSADAKSKALQPKLGQVAGIEEEEDEEEAVNSEDDETPSAAPDAGLDSKQASPKVVKNEADAISTENTATSNLEAQTSTTCAVSVDTSQVLQEMPLFDLSMNETLSRSRESVRSGGDDSCATLSADEGQSETEMGLKSTSTATMEKNIEQRLRSFATSVSQSIVASDMGVDSHPGSIRPGTLPQCQPYKPKSAHIVRLENERKAKEAASNSIGAAAYSTASFLTSTPVSSQTFPSVSSNITLLSKSDNNCVVANTPARTVESTISKISSGSLGDVGALQRNTESPEVIEIVPAKHPGQLKSPPQPRQLNTPTTSDNRYRGSLTQGTPVIPHGPSGAVATFATPQTVTSSARQPTPSLNSPTSRSMASGMSSPMEHLPRTTTPAAVIASAIKTEDLRQGTAQRASSAGLSKSSRPTSSEPAHVQQQQQPFSPSSTLGSLNEQQLYQAILKNQAFVHDHYQRARQLGLNEHQVLALYNATVNASRDQATYANIVANLQQHQQQQQQQLQPPQMQLNPEFHQSLSGPTFSEQLKLSDNASALLALQLQGLDAATQTAIIQQHYYRQQLEQRRLDQQRTLYEHHQRMMAAVEQQRIMATAAAAAAAEQQQRLAMGFVQERLLHQEQQQEQLRQERLQADRRQQDYRTQLLEQQRLMEAQQKSMQRQSPLSHGVAPGFQPFPPAVAQVNVKPGMLQKPGFSQSTQDLNIKREIGSPFSHETRLATMAAQEMISKQDPQKQRVQQRQSSVDQNSRQQKTTASAERKSIIQRNIAAESVNQRPIPQAELARNMTPSLTNQPQQLPTPPATAGFPTKAAMKEFPTTLPNPATNFRPVTPSPVHQTSTPGFPILVRGPLQTIAPVPTKMLPTAVVTTQAVPGITEKVKGTIKSSTPSTSHLQTTINQNLPVIVSTHVSSTNLPTAASLTASLSVATSSKAPDVNLINLVDSIITREEKNQRLATVSGHVLELSNRGVPLVPKAVTSQTSQPESKKEEAVPAIVPISPPASEHLLSFQGHKSLIETNPQSLVTPFSECQLQTASLQCRSTSGPTATTSTVSAQNRTHYETPPSPSKASLFQYIEDIICSDYCGAPVPSSDMESKSCKPETVDLSTTKTSSISNILADEQQAPTPKALQHPIESSSPASASGSIQSGKVDMVPVFEYDLEPVSPPEQNTEEIRTAPQISSFGTTRPLVSVASSVGTAPSSSQAPSFLSWPTQIRPVHTSSPVLALKEPTNSSSVSPAPFMAWNVFTLPEAGTEVISRGVQPGVEPEQQRRQNQLADVCPWQLSSISSSSLDELESSRAVAALLDSEMRPESASSRIQTGDLIQRSATSGQCPLPTYEPLSDDES